MNRFELGALGIALALHAGGVLAARALPPSVWPTGSVTRPLEIVEIEVPETRPQDRVVEPTVGAVTRVDPAAPRPAVQPDRPSSALDPTAPVDPGVVDPAAPVDPGVVTAPGPATSPDEWSAPEWTPPGVGAQNPLWAQPGMLPTAGAPGAPAATAAPAAPKVDRDIANKLLSAELRDRDKKLGISLPAAGAVASLVKSAVYGADVPNDARAAIQVTLGPGGKVLAVRVASASGGDAAAWNGVAAAVKASLAGRKLALTGDFERGATIVVNVQSKMQLPSGSTGEGLDFSATQTFDVTDIGAKARRVIYTTFSATPAP